MQTLTAPELAAWLQDTGRDAPQVLDVREPWEVAYAALPGALTIPMGQVPNRLEDLDPERAVICLCHHGMRSMQVALYLERCGFDQVWNLAGGIDAWARQVDPRCPTY